ncbi:hypothetical protein EVAR_3395_1 [Eumeta japonica]|uniref:Uncharacterized protein n=1 Tax=Eumeta variegata TaxID=151549 RepID=A0A4C1SSE9_EUMVA|nr:hypothetical protein EVAR_3395_1 [Eumeta japonica]
MNWVSDIVSRLVPQNLLARVDRCLFTLQHFNGGKSKPVYNIVSAIERPLPDELRRYIFTMYGSEPLVTTGGSWLSPGRRSTWAEAVQCCTSSLWSPSENLVLLAVMTSMSDVACP